MSLLSIVLLVVGAFTCFVIAAYNITERGPQWLDNIGMGTLFVGSMTGLLVFMNEETPDDRLIRWRGKDPSGYTCRWDFLKTGDGIAKCRPPGPLSCVFDKDTRIVKCFEDAPYDATLEVPTAEFPEVR